MNRTTPGVYITEYNAFPKSVVGVQTAIPAFIGYTAKAVLDGKSVLNTPVLINSMADYRQIFGAEFNTLWDIVPVTPSSGLAIDFTVQNVPYSVLPATNQPQFNLYYSMEMFYANGGSTCYVVSVGDYSAAVTAAALSKGIDAIAYQTGPTMLVVPEAIYLSVEDYYAITGDMLTQASTLQDRVAIFDLLDANTVPQTLDLDRDLDACVTQFQSNPALQNSKSPSYGMAYFPFLNTSIVDTSDINYTNFQNEAASPPAGWSPPPASPALSATPTELQYILTLFNEQQYPTPDPRQSQVQSFIDQVVQDPQLHDDPSTVSLNNLLSSALPQYALLLSIVALKAGVLPPSPAMAGIFTLNDQNRGVWNAPANMSLMSVVSLTVNLNDQQQGSLNVPVNGFAIDVIRDFPGRGSVVWGARTLDGNSQDWRYIQVRRTIIYIEQSIKAAINQFVFAPNVASTWVAVTQMISGFLQGLWSQGGLMGSKASSAFTVLCGVPDTMTATDILNGYMVVQVTLQMVHPAEFIELQFRQTMQGT